MCLSILGQQVLASCSGWVCCRSMFTDAAGQDLHTCVEVGLKEKSTRVALLADGVDHSVQRGFEQAVGPPAGDIFISWSGCIATLINTQRAEQLPCLQPYCLQPQSAARRLYSCHLGTWTSAAKRPKNLCTTQDQLHAVHCQHQLCISLTPMHAHVCGTTKVMMLSAYNPRQISSCVLCCCKAVKCARAC